MVFTNGKVIEGTWMRYDGDATPAKFFDKDGNEIIFNQGKPGSAISGMNMANLSNTSKVFSKAGVRRKVTPVFLYL